MGRSHDTLIPADTTWLNDANAAAVCRAIQDAGHAIYFVGGCVRNALLGLLDSDVDMSTDALPTEVVVIAKAAGLKAIPTGINHGTITVVSGGTTFEVTTFRRDVETDGRRAVVAFSHDIAEDARRRDFTMNALYATPTGVLIDPLDGLSDLLAKRVRFIEDAQQRIKEDYLRILRFFRFSAWYADMDLGFDPDALDAIARNSAGIETLSAERIGAEMKKLLSAPDPAPALAVMRQTGVLGLVLSGADDRFLPIIINFESDLGLPIHWITRLAALGGINVADQLRLSKSEAKELDACISAAYGADGIAKIAYRNGENTAHAALLVRAALAEMPPQKAVLETISHAVQAVFPVKAIDLMPELTGPELGARLRWLENQWISSGFEMTKTDLLSLHKA